MVVLSDVADDTTAELLAEVARLRAERAARSAAPPPPPHRPLPPLSDSIREADDDTDEDNDGDGDDSGSDGDGRPVDGRRFYKAEAAASTPVRTTLNYTNGDTYKGEALPNGKRHGTGRHVCSTGDSYEGSWRDDLRHGRGRAAFSTGLVYDGEWAGDKAHGHGVCSYPNGDEYRGSWRNDKRHGWGLYAMHNGDVYEGVWADDAIHGKGRYRYKEGDVYEGAYEAGNRTQARRVPGPAGRFVCADGSVEYNGSWLNNARHGQGVYHSSGKWKYDGGWEADARVGAGTCVWADGSRYAGAWAADAQHGAGRFDAPDGSWYSGSWAAGLRDGDGEERLADGSRYVGRFVAGLRHGQGIEVTPDGGRYEGGWAEGVRCGAGVEAKADGEMYTGAWAGGKRHGAGAARFADGRKFTGEWRRGCWVQSAAEPRRCKLRGLGLARALAGAPAPFILTARDENGAPRLSGGDAWRAWLKKDGGSGGGGGSGGEEARVEATVADAGDGTYAFEYTLTRAGAWTLHVVDADGGEAAGESPYPVRCLPGPPSRARAALLGLPPGNAVPAREPVTVTVAARDAYGNAVAGRLGGGGGGKTAGGGRGGGGEGAAPPAFPVVVQVTDASGRSVGVELVDTGAGAWEATFTLPFEGLFRLDVAAPPPPGAPARVLLGAPLCGTPVGLRGLPLLHPPPPPPTADAPPHQSTAAPPHLPPPPPAAAAQLPQPPCCGPPPDLSRSWAAIASAAFRAIDGAEDGFESDDGPEETADEAYERKHPGVPVIRNLEDMWQLSKMQALQQRDDAIAAHKAMVAATAAAAEEGAGAGEKKESAPGMPDIPEGSFVSN